VLRATDAGVFAIPEKERFHELLVGEIVHKALSSGGMAHPSSGWEVHRSL
jgi:hypothetical protein